MNKQKIRVDKASVAVGLVPILITDVEIFFSLYLDQNLWYLGYTIFTGTKTSVNPKPLQLFVDNCHRLGARYMITGHTHPAGPAFPSVDDFRCAQRWYDYFKAHDILIMDNIIRTLNTWYSFKGRGHAGVC